MHINSTIQHTYRVCACPPSQNKDCSTLGSSLKRCTIVRGTLSGSMSTLSVLRIPLHIQEYIIVLSQKRKYKYRVGPYWMELTEPSRKDPPDDLESNSTKVQKYKSWDNLEIPYPMESP